MAERELQVGDPVTLTWYTPGERFRPQGEIVRPDAADLARLDGNADGWVLVHWHGPATPDQRRWEHREDVWHDDVETAGPPRE